MSSRLRNLVEEYREKLDRHHELNRRTREIIKDWNSSVSVQLKAVQKKRSPKKVFITDRSRILPTQRVSLSELSKGIDRTPKTEPNFVEKMSRFLSVKNIGSSRELFPKVKSKSMNASTVGVQSQELPSIQMNQPQLKFKLLSKSYHSVEDLFPIKKSTSLPRKQSPRLSFHPKRSQIVSYISHYFNQGYIVIGAVKKQATQLKIKYTYYKAPFDLSDSQRRLEQKKLKMRLIQTFQMNKHRKCFLFDLQGNPLQNLMSLSRCCVILISSLPKIEFSISQQIRQFVQRQNEFLQQLYSQVGVNWAQYITDHKLRVQEKVQFIQSQCVAPSPTKYANQQLLDEYHQIDQAYRRNVEENAKEYRQTKSNAFFNVSPKKKDFDNNQLEMVRARRDMLTKERNQKLLKRSSLQTKILKVKPLYQLSHRDLIKKSRSIQNNHDFLIKTKFNREELLKLKSIYESLLTISIKSHKESVYRGIQRKIVINQLGCFGFDTSINLLEQIIGKQPYLPWPKFIKLMETLIHKNSSESLDEYLQSVGKDHDSLLTFDDIVKVIRYGLQKLIIFKDSFYDGYEILFSRELFKELGRKVEEGIPVDDLKKFLNAQRKHKTFEYIFFQ